MAERNQLDQMMFVPEVKKVIFQGIVDEVTVTHWSMASPSGNDALDLEFEIRVTKIGGTKVPRITKSARGA